MSEFKIEKVEPVKGVRSTTEVYRNVINAIVKEEAGWYKISIPSKKTQTVYQQLVKLVKEHKDMKVHNVKDTVYIEKLKLTTVKKQ